MTRITDEMLAVFGDPPAGPLRACVEGMLAGICSEHGEPARETFSSFLSHVARHTRSTGGPLLETLAALRTNDLWLAHACASGDEHAMKAFGERYHDDVRRALGGVRVSAMDLDDLAQELARRMFVGPAPKIAEYSGRGDLRAWVRMVATRHALDVVRVKKNTAERASDGSVFEGLAAPAKDAPDQAYFRRVYRKHVAAAIQRAAGQLDVEERNALREHYARGLTVDQIAAIHGIHRATAARRVQAAREVLVRSVKRILDEDHGLKGADLASVMGLVRSQLHLTMDRVLG